MKYLKRFEGFENNPRLEVDGFELTNDSFPSSLNTLDESEWDQIKLIMDTHNFESNNYISKKVSGNINHKIEYFKHNDNCYYVKHDSSNEIKLYKCNGFQGLINCINFIGSILS